MSTEQIKANMHRSAEKIDGDAEKVMGKLAADARAFAERCEVLRDEWLGKGRRLLDDTKGLRQEASQQARMHPLATFGVAFAAGLIIARALRR